MIKTCAFANKTLVASAVPGRALKRAHGEATWLTAINGLPKNE
jgi:hypothetical protein